MNRAPTVWGALGLLALACQPAPAVTGAQHRPPTPPPSSLNEAVDAGHAPRLHDSSVARASGAPGGTRVAVEPPPATEPTPLAATVLPGTVLPGTVLPDTVLPDTVLPGTVLPDTVLPDTVLPERVVVMVGGDVNLGRTCGQRILADTAHDPFVGIARLWATADLRVVNLESVLSDQGGETVSPANRFAFTGPPEGARILGRGRIDVVSLANNHAWDYGLEALLSTLRFLDDAGVGRVGAGADIEETQRPWSGTLRGVKLAIVAGTGTWNQGELQKHPARSHVASGEALPMLARVRSARREHDWVLASFHGGMEYSPLAAAKTRRLARAAIDAGADAFVAHHPHVPQGVGFIHGKPVLYSLGNLVFRSLPEEPWTDIGLLAELTFAKAKPPALRLCPVLVGEYLPQAMDAVHLRGRVVEIRRHLLELSQPLGPVVFADPDEQGCFEVAPGEG